MNTRDRAREEIKTQEGALIELSRRIHAHPELGFEEEKASGWLCQSLSDAGFDVQSGVCDMPTAFTARFGSGPLPPKMSLVASPPTPSG